MTLAGPCARVELMVNGRSIGRARMGEIRPDAPSLTGLPAAQLSGFHLTIDLSALPWVENSAEFGGFAVGVDHVTLPLSPVRVSVEDASAESGWQPSAEFEDGEPTASSKPSGAARPDALQLLVCTHELSYGGAQLFLTELLRRFRSEADVEGFVLSPSAGPTRAALENEGFDVYVTTPFSIGSPVDYQTHIEGLAAWLSHNRRFDAALVNTMGAFPGADLCKRLGVPFVWAIHESYPPPELWGTYGQNLHPGVRTRADSALQTAALAAFTTDATRRLYEPYLADVRCATLPYGIDVDALDDWQAGFDRAGWRRREGIPQDATVLLCMGTIEPRKSQTQLIYAFSQVAARHPGALLLIIGSRGDAFSETAHQASVLYGVQERVRIMPVVSDPRPFYGIADLLVSASDVESTPRSILEAMALRLPVLSTDVFGVPELITDRKTGWLFEARDVEAMAHALDEALSFDLDQRTAIAERARAVVESDYRSEVCSREWLRALRGIVSRRPAAHA
jgi:glycosyltransferase involved in cell wall biosynthesis